MEETLAKYFNSHCEEVNPKDDVNYCLEYISK